MEAEATGRSKLQLLVVRDLGKKTRQKEFFKPPPPAPAPPPTALVAAGAAAAAASERLPRLLWWSSPPVEDLRNKFMMFSFYRNITDSRTIFLEISTVIIIL